MVFILLFPAFAQMETVCRFRGVTIPYDLKHEDSVIEKGKYDFELLRHSAQTAFYLRIKRKRDQILLVIGEQLRYASSDEKEIPAKPRMKMRKNSAEKMLYIIIESGTITIKYPAIKVRFKLEYEE